jgi:hypothetical protein
VGLTEGLAQVTRAGRPRHVQLGPDWVSPLPTERVEEGPIPGLQVEVGDAGRQVQGADGVPLKLAQ